MGHIKTTVKNTKKLTKQAPNTKTNPYAHR